MPGATLILFRLLCLLIASFNIDISGCVTWRGRLIKWMVWRVGRYEALLWLHLFFFFFFIVVVFFLSLPSCLIFFIIFFKMFILLLPDHPRSRLISSTHTKKNLYLVATNSSKTEYCHWGLDSGGWIFKWCHNCKSETSRNESRGVSPNTRWKSRLFSCLLSAFYFYTTCFCCVFKILLWKRVSRVTI